MSTNEILYPYNKTVNGVTYTCYKKYIPRGGKRGRPKKTDNQKVVDIKKKMEELKEQLQSLEKPLMII